jgi:hypothetical protein
MIYVAGGGGARPVLDYYYPLGHSVNLLHVPSHISCPHL